MPSAIGNRPRDGACGVAHLLAEGGDAGVSGEREEQQARRLQHAADGDVVDRRQPSGVDVAEAEDDDHHRGQHGEHDATMTRVSSADFWMPA